MARIVAMKESLEKVLKDEGKPWTKLFALAEAKTGLDRLYIFLGNISIFKVTSTPHFLPIKLKISTPKKREKFTNCNIIFLFSQLQLDFSLCTWFLELDNNLFAM